ncbi:MAG TPA: hypothetical protein VKB43_14425 [Gaiellaceae bacterium]|nr:hypothetical protein [Gaiellaceae bacterium]
MAAVNDSTKSTHGGGKAEALKTIGGLVAVGVGLLALILIAIFGMAWVKSDNSSVVSIAAGAFGVIGTIVGAYFGVKVSSDGTQKAIDALKDSETKASTFAAHLDPDKASQAISDYQKLRAGGQS